ncbi:MAG: hypothetical protein M3680_15695 [Myxococcota bacterium]|nr:hypothetical protein [Myxococcota bacterium]
MISAFCAAAALLLTTMASRIELISLASVAAVGWMLMAWPLIVRRFFGDRHFADLASDTAAVHRRAPDAGLTTLGWLLAGHAAVQAMFVIPELVGGSSGSVLQLAASPVAARPASRRRSRGMSACSGSSSPPRSRSCG